MGGCKGRASHLKSRILGFAVVMSRGSEKAKMMD